MKDITVNYAIKEIPPLNVPPGVDPPLFYATAKRLNLMDDDFLLLVYHQWLQMFFCTKSIYI